jgi:hypothetical protein
MAKLYTSDYTGKLRARRPTGLVFLNSGYHFGHWTIMRD